MQDASDQTVVITVDDLLEHTVLSRKLSETEFKISYLLRNGASQQDMHIASLSKVTAELASKLKPISSKLSKVDLLTVVPNASELKMLNEQISKLSLSDVDSALSSSSGTAFELLKRRSAITRANYDLREEICRMTILLNSLPLEDAESIKAYLEGHFEGEINISSLSVEKQQNLLTLMHRLGKKSMLHNGVLKPSAPATGIGAPEATFTVVDGRRVWLGSEKLGAFQENERTITNLSRKLQLLNAERQARSFTSEEHQEYSGLQSQYAQCLEARRSLLDATQVREERVAVAAR